MNQKAFVPIIIVGGILILGMVGGVYYFITQKTSVAPPKACTQEAKICPDGSSVGRTGPNCEFSPCPTTSPTKTQDETANWKTYTNGYFNLSMKYPSDIVHTSYGDDFGKSGYVIFERDGKELLVLNLVDKFAPGGVGNFMGSKPLSKRTIGGKEWDYYNFYYQDKVVITLKYNVIAFETVNNNFLYSFVFNNQTKLTSEQDQILSTFKFN